MPQHPAPSNKVPRSQGGGVDPWRVLFETNRELFDELQKKLRERADAVARELGLSPEDEEKLLRMYGWHDGPGGHAFDPDAPQTYSKHDNRGMGPDGGPPRVYTDQHDPNPYVSPNWAKQHANDVPVPGPHGQVYDPTPGDGKPASYAGQAHVQKIAAQLFEEQYGRPMPNVAGARQKVVRRPGVLTPEQAHAFQMMMIATGANGKSVGNGQVRTVPAAPTESGGGTGRARAI